MKKKRKLVPVEESFAAWRRDPAYVKAYSALEEEFALATALIDARALAGLSQQKLARKMRTSQPAIARLEGGQGNPSLDTLRRFAKATGTRLKITFERAKKSKGTEIGRAAAIACGREFRPRDALKPGF